jgi:RND family efflux transporter MFP subunit
MKTMNRFFFILSTSLIIAACGSKDPAAQLEKLKAERASLDTQIAELEKTLNINPNANIKAKDVLVTVMNPVVFKHFIDVQGIVDAENNVAVQPQMPGVVVKIYVSEGSAVKQGQLLGETDNSVMLAQMNAIQPQLTMAIDVYNRQKRLWEQKIGSELQYLQAKTTKEALEKQIEAIQEQINMTKITAPISGVVDHIGAKIGQYSAPGMPDPAFRVINSSKMKVKAEFAESYVSKVSAGNEVDLYFPDLGINLNTKAQHVAKFINPMTRTFTVETAIPGDLSAYRPNMVAVMKVVDYKNETALVLPINALLTTGSETYVYTVAEENGNKVARRKPIVLGATYDGKAEIVSGITPGESIITTGQFEIADGSVVNF